MTAEQTIIAEENHVKAPWLAFYGVVPEHLQYPDCTMYEAVERCAQKYPSYPAYVFMGRKTSYRALVAEINLCARALKAIGVRVIVHQILGLPGETPEMMAQTSRYIGQAGADGVKLHLLHVLRNTDLAAEWQAGRVQTLELPEYIAALELCLRNLPPEVVIHRLTGDGAKRDLLSPLWSGDKKRVLNAIRRAFERDDLVQGSALSTACKWQRLLPGAYLQKTAAEP